MKFDYTFQGQDELPSPQLIVYREAVKENLKTMIRIAGGADKLWPHVKTHKMIELVKLQIGMGITRFKCATISEAEMCGMAGATDVVLAYPLLGPNVARFLKLVTAYSHTHFYAIGDDTEAVKRAGETAAKEGMTIPFLMDVDLGQNRTGISAAEAAGAYAEWSRFCGVKMVGLHCYDGHRHEADPDERLKLVREEDAQVTAVKEELKSRGIECSIVILGGTPSFPCHVKAMPDASYSPGTCVLWDSGYGNSFPDMDYFTAGAAVLTRVVSHRGPNLITLDLGVKAVASDPAPERASIVGFEDAETILQNEEHWVVRIPQKKNRALPPVGAELFAIPTHVCPTSALYPSVPVVENGRITEWWDVTARDRKITI